MQNQKQYDIKLKLGGISINITATEHFFGHVGSASCYKSHIHAGYELQCILKDGALEVDGRPVSVKSGDALIIPPHVRHRLHLNSDDFERVTFLFFIAGGGRGDSMGAQLVGILAGQRGYALLEGAGKALYPIARDIQSELRERGMFYYERAQAEFLSFFIQLARFMQVSEAHVRPQFPAGWDENRMQQIDDFFENRYTEDITAGDLARSLYISISQLDRILRKLYGKPFRELLLDIRMQSAKYYVEDTSVSLAQIPYLTGYGSSSAFYLAYKKYFGATPGERRRQHSLEKGSA